MCISPALYLWIFIHVHSCAHTRICIHSYTFSLTHIFQFKWNSILPIALGLAFLLKNTVKVVSTLRNFLRTQEVSLACFCWHHQARGLWSRAHQSLLKVPVGSADRPNTRPPPHPCQGQITGSRWVFCWTPPISISAVGSSTKPCLLTHGWWDLRQQWSEKGDHWLEAKGERYLGRTAGWTLPPL